MKRKNKKKPLLKRNKIRYYRKVIIWVTFVVVLLYGVSFWSDHESMKVVNVSVVGDNFVNPEIVEDIFFEKIYGKYFYLISKSHFLFLPRTTIIGEIENMLEIDSTTIKREDMNSVVVEIVEHQPIAEYCLESNCYLVNAEGLIFVKKPDVFLNNLITLSGQIIENNNEGSEDNDEVVEDADILGQSFSDKETFQKLLMKIKLLKEEKIEISNISTEDFETYTLQTVGGPVLLVENQDAPETVVSNLKAALAQESIHKVQFNNIDYIDLRFEDKVFYKLK